MQIIGVAHPPAGATREHDADLSHAEIASTIMGGQPLFLEHDTSKPIGEVLTSWEGTRKEMRVMATVHDASVKRQIEDGTMRGLSLGTDVLSHANGDVLFRAQRELSVCKEGRRNGTWIDHVDGVRVFENRCFSKRRTGNHVLL